MITFYAPPVSRRWLCTTALLITTLLLQSPVSGGIYKWTDASGEVHYTQTPPPNGIATEKIQDAPPPAESQQSIHEDQQKLQERIDAMDERRASQDEEATIKKQHKENREIDEKNCITARTTLPNCSKGV